MKKRILLLWDRLDVVGGVETVLYNIATRLDKEKFDVILGTFKDGKVRDIFEKEGIKVKVFDRKSKFDFKIILKLFNYIKNADIDIIHTHGHFPGIAGRIAGKLAKKKVISTYHLPLNLDEHPKTTHILTKLTLSLADFITFVSKGVQETFCNYALSLEEALRQNEKYCVIYNGIDVDYIQNYCSKLSRKKIRLEYGVKENDVLILNVGRLTKQKGQRYLIQAIKEVIKINSNVKLFIFGEGELGKELKCMINNDNLTDYIKIFSPIKDIYKILFASDIFILPSLYEGLPMSLIEAMAVGVPVIGTNVCGINEIIKNKETGILIEPGDIDEIKKAIMFMIHNKEIALQYAKNAQDVVRNKFSISRMIDEYMTIYERV